MEIYNESKSRYFNGIISYLIIFFLLNAFVSAIIQVIFLSIYEVDTSIFEEVLSSSNFLIYLKDEYINTEYFNAAKLIIKMSSTINLTIYILLFLACSFIYFKDFKVDSNIFTPEIPKRKISLFFKTLVKWIFIYYFINYLSGLIIMLLNNLVNIDSSTNQLIIESSLKYAPIPMIIAAGFLGPLVEELIFRKSIFGLINNKKIALLVSTISFACIHILSSFGQGYNTLQLLVMTIPYITGGLLFGFIYIKTNCNIYYVTIIHMISNLLAIIILLLS